MSNEDFDKAELQRELVQIKEAIGLHERYPSQLGGWLLFGLLVGIASALSQFIHLRGYPGSWHSVVWVGLMGLGLIAMWRMVSGREATGSTTSKPNLFFQFGVVFLALVPLQILVAPYLANLTYTEESMVVFGLVLILVGVAYLVAGNSLRAYHIRGRDRAAFYVGGVWIAVLGAAMPHVAFLRTWGYATLGGLYVAYSVVVYVYLTRA